MFLGLFHLYFNNWSNNHNLSLVFRVLLFKTNHLSNFYNTQWTNHFSIRQLQFRIFFWLHHYIKIYNLLFSFVEKWIIILPVSSLTLSFYNLISIIFIYLCLWSVFISTLVVNSCDSSDLFIICIRSYFFSNKAT